MTTTTRIAPKDLSDAIAAARPGAVIELDSGEHVGQVVIDKPVVIEGRGASTWLGNRTGTVLIIRCAGVELRDLQIEMTGDLQHPAILAEGPFGPVLRNVAIRRGELYVAGPLLRFAPPPPIRLRALTEEEQTAQRASKAAAAGAANGVNEGAIAAVTVAARASTRSDATTLSMPPPPPTVALPGAAAARVEPEPAIAAPLLTPVPPASPLPAASATIARTASAAASAPRAATAPAMLAALRTPRGYAIGLAALALCGGVLYLATRSSPRAPAPKTAAMATTSAGKTAAATASERTTATSTSSDADAPEAPPASDELRLDSDLRTRVDVIGWSRDEERFALEIGYGRDAAAPARWKVRAVVEAASERVLAWQDLSEAPARVVAGEDEQPPWTKDAEAIDLDAFLPSAAVDPGNLEIRWCGNNKAPRFPTSSRAAGQELEVTWGPRKQQLARSACRPSDFGQVLLQVKGSPWRLMRLLPWKGTTSAMRVERSPSGRRVVVIATFRVEGKAVTRFYSRLAGPQIHILSNDAEKRREALRLLDMPGLFMSEDARRPAQPPSRILVRADDAAALELAQQLHARLRERFSLAEIEQVSADGTSSPVNGSYLWGDVLIVLK